MIEIENLVPHKPPMILIDQIVAYTDESVHATLTIREGIPFYENGAVPSYVGIEYMAQAVAAWNGLMLLKQNEPPRIGFLLGTRKLSLSVSQFRTGLILDIHGELKFNDGEMASFSCWIDSAGNRLASATLNVFQPEKQGFIP